ncbi:MAG TPA: ferric reductase-like transmembrane domain-containing protein [Acidimicrobiales bacterium]|nr:ferric reductase-like transmembrane domain-containing protein [Acidimicrobiales bacterium]
MNPQAWWYLARATGIVAWGLLSASVIWGLLLSTRLVRKRSAPKWLLDLHRFLGGLSVVFLGLHLATIVADSYVHFGRADILVPFASHWKPVPVALGVLAFYCSLAVEATSLLMKRLPRRLWRRVHMASFGGFVLATSHGFTAGADHRNLVLFGAYATAAAVVAFLTVYRVLTLRTPRARSAVTVASGPA